MSEDRIIIGDLSPAHVALLKDVAELAAEETVKRTLLAIGIDTSNPIKAQGDFAFLRRISSGDDNEEENADRQWVRRTRKRSDGIIGKAILTAVGLGTVNAFYLLWTGFKTVVERH